jgi:hypothetical protein
LIGKRFDLHRLKRQIMKHLNFPVIAILVAIMFTASSCDAIEGIFKAGMWTAFILIALVVGVILWIVAKMRGRK